jgi:hypothetical protein
MGPPSASLLRSEARPSDSGNFGAVGLYNPRATTWGRSPQGHCKIGRGRTQCEAQTSKRGPELPPASNSPLRLFPRSRRAGQRAGAPMAADGNTLRQASDTNHRSRMQRLPAPDGGCPTAKDAVGLGRNRRSSIIDSRLIVSSSRHRETTAACPYRREAKKTNRPAGPRPGRKANPRSPGRRWLSKPPPGPSPRTTARRCG